MYLISCNTSCKDFGNDSLLFAKCEATLYTPRINWGSVQEWGSRLWKFYNCILYREPMNEQSYSIVFNSEYLDCQISLLST